LEYWLQTTDIPKNKQALTIAQRLHGKAQRVVEI